MHHLLTEIVAAKKAAVAASKQATPEEIVREVCEISRRDFRGSISGGRNEPTPRLIAELKRKSPSKGLIRPDFDFENTLTLYQNYAAAVSVLTDYPYFGGSLEDLAVADETSDLPLLRKDFIVDPYQIYEARQFGADAILLIASILTPAQITEYIGIAREFGMDALVEIHSAAELQQVLTTPAEIIGINNRNLDTLEISLATTHTLLEHIPADKIIVAESGISTAADVAKLAGKVDAMLIGSSILSAENMEEKLKELTQNC